MGRRAFGWILIAFASLGAIGMVQRVAEGKGDVVGGSVVLALIGISGLTMVLRREKALPPAAEVAAARVTAAATDNAILRVARAHAGRITAAEVAAEANLSLAEAAADLDRIAKLGACQMLVGEHGILVYYFPEFENEKAKSEVFFGESSKGS